VCTPNLTESQADAENPQDPRVEDSDDVKEQLQALTEAIYLLTRSIASSNASQSYLQGDTELDKLQKVWKLEETGFPRLYNACKQLKENLRLTAIEADEAVSDINASHQILFEEKNRVNKMNKAVYQLYKENKELRKQNATLTLDVQRCKKEKKIIVEYIRGYNSSIRGKNMEENMNETSCEENMDATSVDISLESFESFESDASHSVSTSSSTSSSLISDVGCATLHLAKKKIPYLAMFRSVLTAPANVYDITFTMNSPGLQFLMLPANTRVDSSMNATNPIFLVCGYKGFRDSLHRRPSFGARLISINNDSLERQEWSMADLISYTNKRGGSMKMRFRNDSISADNMEKIKMRSHELANRH